jgi:hypothetical protein
VWRLTPSIDANSRVDGSAASCARAPIRMAARSCIASSCVKGVGEERSKRMEGECRKVPRSGSLQRLLVDIREARLHGCRGGIALAAGHVLAGGAAALLRGTRGRGGVPLPFFVIGEDPTKFRALMISAVMKKSPDWPGTRQTLPLPTASPVSPSALEVPSSRSSAAAPSRAWSRIMSKSSSNRAIL